MRQVVKKGMHIRKGEEDSFYAHLRAIFARMASERHFGNAGAVINFFGSVFGNQAERLFQEKNADRLELCTADLLQQSVINRSFSEIIAEVDTKYVGLESV